MRLKPASIIFAVLLAGCAALKSAPVPQRPHSLRATAVVEVHRTLALIGRAAVLVKDPGSFRIEVYGPLNQVIALIISNGTNLYIYSEGDSASYRWGGPAIPYALGPDELASVLLGAWPPHPSEGAPPPNGGYGIDRDGRGRVTGIRGEKDGAKVTVSFSQYASVDGFEIPFRISVDNGREKLVIRYSAVEVNPILAEELFSPGPP